MRWVPVPGIGAGVWEPGMDLGAYLDRLLIGEGHLWAQARTWDPEGVFSTVPAVGTVLLGWFAGEWLRSGRPPAERVGWMLAAGAAAVALGQAWGLVFPINKPLWTSSYVLFTGGLALIALALCHWVVDLRRVRWWTPPFVVLGVNAITAFFLSSLMARVLVLLPGPGGDPLKSWIYERILLPPLTPVNASLAFALAYVALWVGAMWVLHRRRIFIRI